MEIYAFDAAGNLVEADVIEALEASAVDGLYTMVRNQKIFFPTHEQMFFLHPVLFYHFWSAGVLGKRLVRWKSTPVLAIDLLVRSPLGVLGNECVFAADDLALKVRSQAWMVFREAWKVLVTAKDNPGMCTVGC